MENIDVLLVGMRGILGDIVREIVAQQPDMEIVGDVDDVRELLSATPLASSVVIACLVEGSDLPYDCHELLGRHPRVTLLTVHGDGRQGALYRARPERLPIGDLSPAALMDAIREPTRSNAYSA